MIASVSAYLGICLTQVGLVCDLVI